ncbi:MAG: hypothetical protein AABZ14_08580 [Candidatus Margulisiibacteriota bacterium]
MRNKVISIGVEKHGRSGLVNVLRHVLGGIWAFYRFLEETQNINTITKVQEARAIQYYLDKIQSPTLNETGCVLKICAEWAQSWRNRANSDYRNRANEYGSLGDRELKIVNENLNKTMNEIQRTILSKVHEIIEKFSRRNADLVPKIYKNVIEVLMNLELTNTQKTHLLLIEQCAPESLYALASQFCNQWTEPVMKAILMKVWMSDLSDLENVYDLFHEEWNLLMKRLIKLL